MPVVSRFFGIVIAFYWEDHRPPHFHAKYSGDEAMINIRTGDVLRWERASQRKPLAYVNPLE